MSDKKVFIVKLYQEFIPILDSIIGHLEQWLVYVRTAGYTEEKIKEMLQTCIEKMEILKT